MLLQSYHLDVINNHCMPSAQSVNCIARLDQDVGCAIPYLNAVIEGDQFTAPFCCYGNDVDCDRCGSWGVFASAAKMSGPWDSPDV